MKTLSKQPRWSSLSMSRWLIVFAVFTFCMMGILHTANAQWTLPVVAVHDSELTRALETRVAASPTPSGPGTTGFEWWPTNWHYFLIADSVKEALRADGTAFSVVGDSNIISGSLLTNGVPKYPILISLASEAIRNDEIAPLTNYVAAGGVLLVGSSSFTRNTNGTTRGNFAIANEMGVNMVNSGLSNWLANATFTKQSDHRLLTHVPDGALIWSTPSAAEETSWGISPAHPARPPHQVWLVQSSNATVIAQADISPYLVIKPYGNGYFIYYAGMQPLVGHGGWAPSMYTYMIFRKAIEWAFELSKLPVTRLSPWPYAYDSAFMVRHDLENFGDEVANIEASAQVEFAAGAKGDYYFCTGTLRVDMPPNYNTNAVVASLRRAITNYGATIGPHNGGLRNPNNPALNTPDYDYWHWGLDEALDVTPAGYPSGKAYALASLSNAFLEIESWLPGLMTNGMRTWVAPYFNATREDSYDIQAQLGVKINGDQKISPFPHWGLSTKTAGKRYPFLSIPVSDWFVSTLIGQSMEAGHNQTTVHALVDFYYDNGLLINLYSHTLSTGQGYAGGLAPDYITYALNTNSHPRLWSANSIGIYEWWLKRSNAVVRSSATLTNGQSITTLTVTGANDPNTAVELFLPNIGAVSSLQIRTNGVLATGSSYRIKGQTMKILVGTSVANVVVSYSISPKASSDYFVCTAGTTLIVPAPGILGNDSAGFLGTNLSAVLVNGPASGTLNLSTNGGFTYTPLANFTGTDGFTYKAYDGQTNSSTVGVTITVRPANAMFFDDFARPTGADTIAPWLAATGVWSITNGVMLGSGGLQTYSSAYINSNSWTDYSVQARFRHPAGAFGGGLGGRVNPTTGAHYGAWIYPEGSAAGSMVLKLVKYTSWTSWSGSPMQQASLAEVGTNWHTLKLNFQGNQITVFYDGAQVINVTDNNFEGRPSYATGGITADMWTYTTPYTMSVDDVVVLPLSTGPTANNDTYNMFSGSSLSTPAPGVLGNDTGSGTLTAQLVSAAAHGNLSLTNNGGFNYTPTNNFSGVDTFSYRTSDGVNLSSPATVTITIIQTNHPPVANNNSYNMNAGTTLSISNPGILSNDSDPDFDNLTAVLVNGPTHGILSLTNNGGFAYTPTNGYVGNDTFTYRANDGLTNSGVATVTISVTPTNLPPVANNDTYSLLPNTSLTVSAPGVLGNDTDSNGNPLTAVLVNGPTHGSLTLNTNGGFIYTPTNTFVGTDTFTYRANDGVTNSGVATVTINSLAAGVSFSDDFTRPADPGALAPWQLRSGTWTVTGGALQAGLNTAYTYANVYLTNSWSNYSVQARIRLAAGGFGGGISGRLNPNTGARYAVWVYPEGSTGGARTLKLVKFQSWTAWGYTNVSAVPMRQVSLSNVGTNWHTIKVGFFGNRISVYFDGGQMMNVTDVEASPYQSGGISADMWTDATQYRMWLDDVVVNPLVTDDVYATNEDTTLTIPSPGVLANDTEMYGTNLSAVLLNGPAHGALNLNTNGGFVYTPATNFFGTDSFAYQANNAQTNLGAAVVTITVSPLNNAPTLPVQTDVTIDELTTLTVTNTASDTDVPANSLTYQLIAPPAGASIDTNGVITWTPTEAQGPTSKVIMTVVSDDGVPPLSATNSFLVTVNEVNSTPSLPIQTNVTIDELTALTVTNTASDIDAPVNTLSYQLLTAPIGAVIDTNGVITWTPTEAQGPSTNTITTVVTDNGQPQLSATNSFMVTVNEVNSSPSLPIQTNVTIDELTALTVTNTAIDIDGPANALSYQLLGGPAGAVIDTNGVISWTPTETQGPSTNTITTVVTDSGQPQLSVTNSFVVTVIEVNSAPILPVQTNRIVNDLTSLTVTNQATDEDIPINALNYQLVSAPSGAAIDSSGVITWTPTVAQGPSTNTFTTVVSDNGVPPLSVTNDFLVVVNSPQNIPPPDIQFISISNNIVRITWSAVAGKSYRLQYSDTTDGTNWNNQVPDIIATGTTAVSTNALGAAPRRFYRVMLLP